LSDRLVSLRKLQFDDIAGLERIDRCDDVGLMDAEHRPIRGRKDQEKDSHAEA